MAFRLLFTTARNLSIKSSFAHRFPTNLSNNNFIQNQLLNCESPIINNIRPISFLQKRTGVELWDSVTSVSNAGRKRGRAKLAGKGKTKNLNAGQVIGEGRQRLSLPGLNTPVKQGERVQKQAEDKSDPEWNQKLYQIRDQARARRGHKLTHMERGYSGSKLAGRSVGPPDGPNFVDFDTRVIENKMLQFMKPLGRVRSHSTFVVTGNGNGIAGFGAGNLPDSKSTIRLAKKRAASRLINFHLNGRTIYHDFYTQFGPTTIFVYKMPEGFGVRAHRVIKTLCKLIGLTDIRAKIEGSTHPTKIVRAFFVGLLQQKTYDQMAEEKKLFLVEFSPNHRFFPKIIGRPADLSTLRKADEISSDEMMDYKQFCFNGKIPLKAVPRERHEGWKLLPGYQRFLKRKEKKRSHLQTKVHLMVRYGRLTSFLNEEYDRKKQEKTDETL